jgi:hypothetical protein
MKTKFLVAIHDFIMGNCDKIQALFGIINAEQYGVDRKARALANVLGVYSEDVPTVARRVGNGASSVKSCLLWREYLAAAMRQDWMSFTEEAEALREARTTLRAFEKLDWLRVPLSTRKARRDAGFGSYTRGDRAQRSYNAEKLYVSRGNLTRIWIGLPV